MTIHNALTIDVEDYCMVSAFANVIKYEDWHKHESRVERNTYKVLELLDKYNIKATFFVLGWVAQHKKGLVRDIQKEGHEIASHGYKHELVYDIGPENFRNDLKLSKALLEDCCGIKVTGYRAPSYSITRNSLWAIDILIEEGFLYDSSIFPVVHDIYGIPNAKRFPHVITTSSGTIREFPISTFEIKFRKSSFRIPVGGGGYLRLFPVSIINKAVNHINKVEEQPAVIYFHPWEIDPDQPRIQASRRSMFRHYLNLEKTFGKIEYLLTTLKFKTMSDVLLDTL
jgi:polysaccharide deacetylase family protein (PEP-CTERM system associated)